MIDMQVGKKMEGLDPRWQVNGRGALERTVKWPDFVEAVNFLNDVAEEAEEQNHHPDMCVFGYNKVRVELITHSEGKITSKDYELARAVDELVS